MGQLSLVFEVVTCLGFFNQACLCSILDSFPTILASLQMLVLVNALTVASQADLPF